MCTSVKAHTHVTQNNYKYIYNELSKLENILNFIYYYNLCIGYV